MLTIADFEVLLNNPESSTLDFKSEMYDFTEDKDNIKIGKFVKDVLSFCNTIRNEISYIILGVHEENGEKKFNGISKVIDDAILQDKVKDKIFPRPIFKFYSINYQNKTFGVLEFPITKYSTPIHPTVKMKGLEIGRIYYRRGTANTEAIGHEIITINNWLQSLPETYEVDSLQKEINSLIKRLTSQEEKLSTIFADMLLTAKEFRIQGLIDFCTVEIRGVKYNQSDNQNDLQYRIQKLKISLDNVQINPYSYMANEHSLKTEMENSEDFYDLNIMFPHSISQIESYMQKFNPKTICMTINMSSRQLFQNKDGSDYNIIGYAFKDNFQNLYRNIRQRAIDKLMEI